MADEILLGIRVPTLLIGRWIPDPQIRELTPTPVRDKQDR